MRVWFGLLVLILTARIGSLAAQVKPEWIARYNGPALRSSAQAVTVDPKGNVYVTGWSVGADSDMDYATVKYDPYGNERWVARYNGPGNSTDSALGVAVDGAGNVYVTGWSMGVGTNSDYATIKYDADGNQRWVARYNGPDNCSDAGLALALDATGYVYVAGWSIGKATDTDYVTIKYDPEGNELWTSRYNGPGNFEDNASALALDAEGNVYVTGWSTGIGTDTDYATVKYDAGGDLVWVARYNGPANRAEYSTSLAVDAAGNVYVTGWSMGLRWDTDYATVKYDADGEERWVARYDGPLNGDDDGVALALAGDYLYVIGRSVGAGTGLDYVTVQYDQDGIERWVARYNGPGNREDWPIALAVDAEGYVYVAGTSTGLETRRDYATVKYDAGGKEVWSVRYDGPVQADDTLAALALTAAGHVYVTGSTCLGLDKRGFCAGTAYATIKYLQE